MPDYLIVADDLSGACDTAVQFRKFGFRTLVLNNQSAGNELIDRFDAVAITTNSRDLQPNEAKQCVREICPFIKRLNPVSIYKKIDSTWRGNIGAELEVLLEELQLSFAIICSAYPENKRLGLGGYLLVDGRLLHHTAMAKDPASPIREGYLPALLSRQTKLPVEYLPLKLIEEGTSALQAFLIRRIQNGPCLFVSDATEQAHLECLAGIPAKDLPPFIFVGSAGLSAAMLQLDRKQAEQKVLPILTVVGSVNPKNFIQIERLVETRNTRELYVPWQFLLEYDAESSKRLLSDAVEILSNGNDLILRTSRSSDDMETAKSEGKKIGLSHAKVADAISDGLQRFVMRILEKVKVGGLMVTGGTTALKLLQETGCEGIEVFREIEPGVPLGEIVGGNLDGLKIVTKAGGFGSPDVFRIGMDAIKSFNEPES